MQDPFCHHPELRPLIKDPLASDLRNFEPQDLAVRHPELDISDFLVPKSAREAERHAYLAAHGAQDLWVFGYGSLCWDPAFQFEEVRRAKVTGFKRRFIVADIYGGRGTKDAPGLMAALDHSPDVQGACDGLAFRINGKTLESETPQIWARERAVSAYQQETVSVQLSDGVVQALTFVADHGAPIIRPEISREEQVRFLATGTGFLGNSFDYGVNLETNLGALGIKDPDLSDLLISARRHKQGLD